MSKVYCKLQWDQERVYLRVYSGELSIEGKPHEYYSDFKKDDTVANPKKAINEVMRKLKEDYKISTKDIEWLKQY